MVTYTVFYTATGSSSVDISGSLTSANFPSGYTVSNITQVAIGNTVTSIGKNVFTDATSLTSVTFYPGSTLASIGMNAFKRTGITNFNIPNTVTTIGSLSFYDTALTSIIIPELVTLIGPSSFALSELTTATVNYNRLDRYGNDPFGSGFPADIGENQIIGGKEGVFIIGYNVVFYKLWRPFRFL